MRRRMPPEYVLSGLSAASASDTRSSTSWARVAASRFDSRESRPTISRFSRPVSVSSTAANCPAVPMHRRTAISSFTTSNPDTRGATVGLQQGGEDAHEGGLAGTVRAEQRQHASLVDLEVDAHHRDRVAERLRDAFHLDDRRHTRTMVRRPSRGRVGSERKLAERVFVGDEFSVPSTRAAGSLVGSSPFSHAPGGGVDKGVRGFDSDDRGGRSEPTSPDRRERAGTNNKCEHQRA